MLRLCVFCGSAFGVSEAYARVARELGAALAEREIGLVYGGSQRGLMGVLADAVLARGGDAIGVIPSFMVEREMAHRGLRELLMVSSMHERKATMVARADAFLALPGGFGTLDELMEVLSWKQLGLHDKPIALLDVDGYFHGLHEFVQHMVRAGFVSEAQGQNLQVGRSVAEVLALLFGAHKP